MLYSSGEKPVGFATRSVSQLPRLEPQLALRAHCASSPTCGPYEKQQQNQGRLPQELKLEQQRLRYQLQEEWISSLVLVQEMEQALALVLELALNQELELELDLE